jgi:hypothetical protein
MRIAVGWVRLRAAAVRPHSFRRGRAALLHFLYDFPVWRTHKPYTERVSCLEHGRIQATAADAAGQPDVKQTINSKDIMKKNLLLIASLALAFTTLPLVAQSNGGGKGGKDKTPPANCDKVCPNPGEGRGPNPNPGTPRGPGPGYGQGSGNCQGSGYCDGAGQGQQKRARQGQGSGQGQGQGQQKRAGQK